MTELEMIKSCFLTEYQMIHRPGALTLLEWMEGNGFFEAPASAKHHGAYPGGLAIHSVHVCDRLKRLAEVTRTFIHPETLAVCALLHDVCKIDAYTAETVPGPDGTPHEVRYKYTGGLPVGHGEKSVMLVLRKMKLTDEEIMAISWHMGAFDYRFKGGSGDMDAAFKRSRLAVLLHIADMMATYFDDDESGDGA